MNRGTHCKDYSVLEPRKISFLGSANEQLLQSEKVSFAAKCFDITRFLLDYDCVFMIVFKCQTCQKYFSFSYLQAWRDFRQFFLNKFILAYNFNNCMGCAW